MSPRKKLRQVPGNEVDFLYVSFKLISAEAQPNSPFSECRVRQIEKPRVQIVGDFPLSLPRVKANISFRSTQ